MGGDSFQMSKFFINRDNVSGDRVLITGEDVKHIRSVLRMEPGDILTVCDGDGKDYLARIAKMDSQAVTADIVEVKECGTEPPIEVVLYQGLPKSDKMELIIQKSVELGVKRIVPVITERTVVKLHSKDDAANKIGRWQKIALEAAKQCNRGMIPNIGFPLDFKTAVDMAGRAQLSIIPYEKEETSSLKNLLKNCINTVSVMIGPEGGFSEEEIDFAKRSGVIPVTLGPRILRTETAGLAVLSILMYQMGDMGG